MTENGFCPCGNFGVLGQDCPLCGKPFSSDANMVFPESPDHSANVLEDHKDAAIEEFVARYNPRLQLAEALEIPELSKFTLPEVEVPVTGIVRKTTTIMVTPESSRGSSLAGTAWRFAKTYIDLPNIKYLDGAVSEVMNFHNDDSLTSSRSSRRETNSWEQSGNIVHIYLNQKYSTEIGTLSGDKMSGTGSNSKGEKWNWEAVFVE